MNAAISKPIRIRRKHLSFWIPSITPVSTLCSIALPRQPSGEWLEVKERLGYKVKEIVERQGASFAFPSSSIYVERLPFGQPEAFPFAKTTKSIPLRSDQENPTISVRNRFTPKSDQFGEFPLLRFFILYPRSHPALSIN